MSHGYFPAPIELDADPAARTTRARPSVKAAPVFSTLVEDFGELRTVQRDREPAPRPAPAAVARRGEAVLRLITPGQRLRQIRLLAGQALVIGRSSASDLKLHDAALSRTHLKVQLGPCGVLATDLGSTNGSYLRGLNFTHAMLQVGDHVVFGQSVLEVVRVSSAARAAA
jgi:pSer/pThr/pTyr-binding forkhead associated (FHA) protein